MPHRFSGLAHQVRMTNPPWIQSWPIFLDPRYHWIIISINDLSANLRTLWWASSEKAKYETKIDLYNTRIPDPTSTILPKAQKKTCLYNSKDSRPINLFPKKQRSRSSRHHDGINETALLRLRVTTFVTSYSRWKSKSPSTTKEDKALVDGQLRKMTKILPFYIKCGQGFEGFLPCNPGCSPNIIHVCLRPGSKH